MLRREIFLKKESLRSTKYLKNTEKLILPGSPVVSNQRVISTSVLNSTVLSNKNKESIYEWR